MKKTQRNWLFQAGPAALSLIWSVILACGILGCQGCKSGSEARNTDVGDPDKIISAGSGDTRPGQSKDGATHANERPTGSAPDETLGEKARRLESAIEFVEEQLTSAPGELGISILTGGDVSTIKAKMLDKFTGMLNAAPSDPRYLYLAGHANILVGEIKKAREYFEKCVAEADWFLPAWKGIALSWAAEKNSEKATDAASRLRDASDLGPFGLILLAEVMVETGKEKESEALLLKSLDEHPASIYPLMALAEFYRRQRRWEEAFDKVDKAVRRSPNNQKVWFSKAESHGMMLQDAMRRMRTDPRAREDYQTHLDLLKDALEKCRSIDPNSFRGREAGRTLERIKSPEEEFKKTVLDPAIPLDTRMRALVRLSGSVETCGADFWKEVLALPEKQLRMIAIKFLGRWPSGEAVALISGVLSGSNHIERSEAVQALNTMIKAYPDDARKHSLSIVRGLLGCMEESIKNLESGSEDPYDVNPLFKDMLELLGKYTGGMRFGEGDIATLEGKKATLEKWRDWLSGQADSGAKQGGSGGDSSGD